MNSTPKEKENPTQKGSNFKNIVFSVLGWYFGISFLLLSIIFLFSDPTIAIPSLLIGLLLLPPSKKIIRLSIKTKTLTIIGLLIIFGAVSSRVDRHKETQALISDFEENKEQIIESIEVKINNNEFEDALTMISEKLALVKDDKDLIDLQKKAEANNILAELKTVPATDFKKNMELYKRISEIYPENETYASKFKYYTEKYNKKLAAEAAEEARRKKIEEQFSAWDGSHYNLTRYIKKCMNDPKSYEHVETRYSDRGDHILIITSFRGKNVFGGVVVNTAIATATIDGDLLSVEFVD